MPTPSTIAEPRSDKASKGTQSIWRRDLIPQGWRTGGDVPCCGGAGKSVTHVPIPFFLAPRRTKQGEQAFVEPCGQHFRITVFLCTVLIALFLAFAVFTGLAGAWWVMALEGAFILFFVFLLGAAVRNKNTARRLVFSPQDLSVAIQVVRSSGLVISEARAPIAQCAASIHPVRLTNRDLNLPDFTGWLMRVAVGDRCFTLACSKSHEDILECTRHLPAWLLAITNTNGELVTGGLYDRWLGEPPEEFRKWW